MAKSKQTGIHLKEDTFLGANKVKKYNLHLT